MTLIPLKEGQATLPTEKSTNSYWHKEPSQVLLGHHTTKDLPETADVVLIGTGIAGAFAARELVAKGQKVLVLEAREVCWGATGRNGGHCQPIIYSKKPHIARFELATFQHIKSLVHKHSIPCDWRDVGGVHSSPSQEIVDLIAKRMEQLKRTEPDLAELCKLVTDKEELAKLRVTSPGAVTQVHAAKLWPYKLIAWIFEDLLKNTTPETFNLQTHTPVSSLQPAENSWVIHTPRGQVSAQKILLATNGYTSHLLPKMTGLIIPTRGQCASLVAPKGSAILPNTHVFSCEEHDTEDYLIQRDTGELIFGGERQSVEGNELGVSNDDVYDEGAAFYLRNSITQGITFPNAEGKVSVPLEASHMWTGIMGYSQDGHPWVGEVPKCLGGTGDSRLWITAGFSGHGMPLAARCAIAAVERMTGSKSTVDLPPEFEISDARVQHAAPYVNRTRTPRLKNTLTMRLAEL